MADLKAFAEQLVGLTVKEVNELAKILKEEYGIEPAAAAVAVAAGPAAGGGARLLRQHHEPLPHQAAAEHRQRLDDPRQYRHVQDVQLPDLTWTPCSN